MRARLLAAILAALAVILAIYIVAGYGLVALSGERYVKDWISGLGEKYVAGSIKDVGSPEAVTSIVWDYRGLDTLFETGVFFLAVIGTLSLFRGMERGGERGAGKDAGMSLIVKTVTRITVFLIVVVSASIALHGQITPGGGFQGGAALAVAPLLAIVAFGRGALVERGVRETLILGLRSLMVTIIALVALSPLLIGYLRGAEMYIMQNQAKPWAPISLLPGYAADTFLGGTLVVFNVAEFIAVGAAFAAVFLVLSVPEERAREVMGGGGHGR